jgi:hypothetical protein
METLRLLSPTRRREQRGTLISKYIRTLLAACRLSLTKATTIKYLSAVSKERLLISIAITLLSMISKHRRKTLTHRNSSSKTYQSQCGCYLKVVKKEKLRRKLWMSRSFIPCHRRTITLPLALKARFLSSTRLPESKVPPMKTLLRVEKTHPLIWVSLKRPETLCKKLRNALGLVKIIL